MDFSTFDYTCVILRVNPHDTGFFLNSLMTLSYDTDGFRASLSASSS